MLGICDDCRKLRNVKLPSGYDPLWLVRDHPSIKWRCAECHAKALADISKRPIEIEIHERYLIRYQAVIPFLASVAFIIMTCFEIAWHS